MSIEELLKSTFGARAASHIDQLFEAVKSEEDNRRKAVQILKSTRKDDVLTYFINQGGLALIHEWLTEWTAADSAGNNAIEAMKLLRQLPVTLEQLRSNKDLCRFLSHLKKSCVDAALVEITSDVVDLWKREGGAEVVFRQEEEEDDPSRRDADATKVSVVGAANKPSSRDTSRERKKASKAAPLKTHPRDLASSGSNAPSNDKYPGSAASSSNAASSGQNLIVKGSDMKTWKRLR